MKIPTVLVIGLFFCAQVSEVMCVYKKLRLSSSKDTVWTLENKNGSIKVPGSVPGGVYSDLMKAGVIGDILAGFNDVLTRWVAYDTWTYTGHFNVSEYQLGSAEAQLVLYGVDTIATVDLNGEPLGTTENMFVRYAFDIKRHLKVGLNELRVTFVSPVEAARERSDRFFTPPDCVPDVYNGECHANQLRKMQASFSWDWGPAFPSVGLWKKAEIEFYEHAILRTFTTHTKKKDQYWQLILNAYLESSKVAKYMTVFISANVDVEAGRNVVVAKNYDVSTRDDGTAEVQIKMRLSENVVREWWPNGYGSQPLYNVYLIMSTRGEKGDVTSVQKRVGFRTVELVQVDASLKLGNSTGGEGLTFYFEVNGYPLFMKGSNWIPAHILPEYSNERNRLKELLSSVKEAHMSMLRVWGGGMYEDDYFYELCDEYGILIWQDFLFACSMYPADMSFLENVKNEIRQNVINLQSHACMALWAGNNENEAALRDNWYQTASNFEKYKQDYIKLYVDTIRPIVENLDDLEYLVSSPSNGLKSEMDGYIAKNPYDPKYGDTHYYNYLADNWDINTFPKTRFASEYGVQSLPSLSTMRQATDNVKDFDLKSEYSKHRQHSPNGYEYIQAQIEKRMNLNESDPKYFEKFVFYSQISQAMAIKTQTEFYRQSQADWYTMGALYWQLNDVWQAPSWSGIEYGDKWKMLHYFAKSFFAPVLVSPRLLETGDVDVYLINDRFVPIIDAKITVDVFTWGSLTPTCSTTHPGNVPALSSKRQPFRVKMYDQKTDEIFLRFTLRSEGVSSPFNYVFPKPLKSIKGLKEPKIQITVTRSQEHAEEKMYHYNVDIKVDTVVLFLWLETNQVKGKFADNGFIITTPDVRVSFISSHDVEPEELQRDIKYQYYMN